ncbi:MAG TPA: CDP-alcohol phosphatidyltransferase family protein [Atopostipes sp.]|nr:CDP-alcohol phosphatidyltransferase family protein [Atopostipes sp.]
MKVGRVLIKKEDWLTIPNILSYVRIAMIPLYIYLYVSAETAEQYYKAAGILVLSGITDSLDGIIARKTGQITDLGKALDPLADKLTQIAVVGAMFVERPYILPLLVLFIGKELYLLISNVLLFKKDIFMDGAMWFGKLATAFFYISMLALVALPRLGKSTSLLIINVNIILQLVALLGYSRWFLKKFRSEKNKEIDN